MRILITGATGFLGSLVVERLRRSHELVLFGRRPAWVEGTSFAQGDITDRATLPQALEGCEAVIHLAGKVSQHPDDARELFDLHVRGTENVLDEAHRAGVKRVVYMSTSGTVAVSTDPNCITNEHSPTPKDIVYRWPYYRTKLIAEEAALARNAVDFQVVSLNPSVLFGPGDLLGESTRSVRMFLEGQVPVSPPGGLSFADVRDVAAAVETALHRGRGGDRYLLGSANITFHGLFERLARIANRPAPVLRGPALLRDVLGWLPEWGREGMGFGFTVDRWGMEQACYTWYLDDSRARAELRWSPRDPIDTLRDTVMDYLGRQAGSRGVARR